MDQAEKYKDFKKRNEQQLITIRKLEAHIEKARQQVENKRRITSQLHVQNEQFKQMTLQQTNYQKRIIDKQDISQPKRMSLSGKRDLTKLIVLTPERICDKLEQLIRAQISLRQPITKEDLSQIESMVNRLPDPYNKQQFNTIIQNLINEYNERNLSSYSHYEMDNKKVNLIQEYLEHRKRKVNDLSKRHEQLIAECQEAEILLRKRVEELQDDPLVQHALTKNVRLKAANHQAQTELHSMRNQIEELESEIDKIENQTKENFINQELDALNKLSAKQKQIQVVLKSNMSCHERLKYQGSESKEEKLKGSTLLLNRIDDIKEKLMKNMTSINGQSLVEDGSKELLNAKDKMSPYSNISTIQFVKEILMAMQSINNLEHESVVELCSEIRETLEDLVKKWGSTLNEQHVHIPSDVPEYHDGIDSVIQSIDAIRLHFQEKELAYIKVQENKLKSKLLTSDHIEKEIETVQDVLEERGLLTNIGESFAVSDKSFREWSDELSLF